MRALPVADVDEEAAHRLCELEMVAARPGHERRAVGRGHARKTHEPLLRYVELASQPPERARQKVSLGILGRHRDLARSVQFFAGVFVRGEFLRVAVGEIHAGVDRVVGPLEFPGAFPLRSLQQARLAIPLHRQRRHGLARDEFRHEGEHVEGPVVAIHLPRVLEERVAAGLVGDSRHRHDLAFWHAREPGRRSAGVVHPAVDIKIALDPIEEPGGEGRGGLLGIRGRVPPPLVFGLLDEPDVGVERGAADPVDPLLDERPVGGGPVGGDLRDRRRTCAARTTW